MEILTSIAAWGGFAVAVTHLFIYFLGRNGRIKAQEQTDIKIEQMTGQTEELKNQTNQLEYNNQLLASRNEELQRSQDNIENLIKILIETQKSTTKIEQEKAKLAQQKLDEEKELKKINAKPFLKTQHFSRPKVNDQAMVTLKNFGGNAKIIDIKISPDKNITVSKVIGTTVPKHGEISISWRSTNANKTLHYGFNSVISLEDNLGNTYNQRFIYKASGDYLLEDPTEFKS